MVDNDSGDDGPNDPHHFTAPAHVARRSFRVLERRQPTRRHSQGLTRNRPWRTLSPTSTGVTKSLRVWRSIWERHLVEFDWEAVAEQPQRSWPRKVARGLLCAGSEARNPELNRALRTYPMIHPAERGF